MILFNGKETDELPDNITLDIQGSGHVIELNEFKGSGILHIKLRGNGCLIYFGKNNIIEKGTLSIIGNNYPGKICEGYCHIGNGNKFRGNFPIYLPLQKDKGVVIGHDNLFAPKCEIIGCMEHVVYDVKTNNPLNKEDNVIIGNYNWIGRDVLFMNKSGIANNSVVGIRSIVTKKFTDSNILIAGCPAKQRKTNINWSESQ